VNAEIEFCLNRADQATILKHLLDCDSEFLPRLSERVEIPSYSLKIQESATRFEAWNASHLVGLLAAYCNDAEQRAAFITSVSILKQWQGKGIAQQLLDQCIARIRGLGFAQIELEVALDNSKAVLLYAGRGFVTQQANSTTAKMRLELGVRT